MILMSIIPEIIVSIFCLASPLVSNGFACLFMAIGIAKIVVYVMLNVDYEFFTVLSTSIAGFLYEVGFVLKMMCNIEESQIFKEAFASILGVICGIFLFAIIQKLQKKKSFCITSIVLNLGILIAAIIVFKFCDAGNGDGSIAIKGFSIQLPELLKILLVIDTYLVSLKMYKTREAVSFLYVVAVVICMIFCFGFKEFGSIVILFFYTISIGTLMGLDKKFKVNKPNKITNIFTSAAFPLITGSIVLIVIYNLKKWLYTKYPLRGEIGEFLYKDDRWFTLSSRLWSDSTQIQMARSALINAPFINLNLNSQFSVDYATSKTAISDFCLVVLAKNFGKIFSIALFGCIFLWLIYSIIKTNYLGRACSIMMLSQIACQICGIVIGFLYTGVNIPLISCGASSAFSSTILVTLIVLSQRRKL